MSIAKNWCFTLNNYCEEELNLLEAIGDELPEPVRYLCYGKEVGSNGTPHLQGYISLDRKKRRSYLKELISVRAHFEVAKGSPSQNRDYCSKDGDFVEFGRCPGGKGGRNDITLLKQAIEGGARYDEIRDSFPKLYLRYEKAINKWIQDLQPSRNWVPKVNVFTGDTGTGKTRSVYEFTDAKNIYKHPGGGWFDGYNGQSVALFDDFNGGEFKLTYLLQLLDRYPMMVPVKGGFVNWIPKHIYITSNKEVEEWYQNCSDKHLSALKRRISFIKKF
jgi:hypothetical protein